jgi:hypothetical protein
MITPGWTWIRSPVTPEPSVPTQMSRIAGFFRDLRNMPWISPHVTVDFDPADGERARYAHTQGTGRSWYTGHLQDSDLLAGDSRRLTTPSGHAFGPAPGSSATLTPSHGSGSASNSSEGASTHLPTAHTLRIHTLFKRWHCRLSLFTIILSLACRLCNNNSSP